MSPTSTKIARRRRRGFTLVELMVSLVAGLIIAMAVVGLAKAATATFHEEARLSNVEGAVRIASERIRQDLTRAAFMSTGNIRLARSNNDGPPRVPQHLRIAVPRGLAATGTSGSRYNGLNDLAGIRIVVGGSGGFPIGAFAGSQGPNNLATNNTLNPDAFFVSGNLSTDDSYQGMVVGAGVLAGGCGGQAVHIRRNADAAVRRLLDQTSPIAAMQAAFAPVAGRDFAARIVDSQGCHHYAPVCAVSIDGSGLCAPGDVCGVIHLRAAAAGDAILDPATSMDNCGAAEGSPVTINPVRTVRYYIGANTDAALATDPNVEPNGNKFNLYREMMDSADPPQPIPGGREIVTEFAIDLKLGITVDDPGTPAPNNMRVFEMDSDPGGGAGVIDTWTAAASVTNPNGPGPQRVRSVRYRIATRSAIADRTANLIVPPGAPFLARYCIENAAPAACKKFARVRTIVSEVALMNQLGMTY